MSLYILDTDILTLLQDGDPAAIRNVVNHTADELAITVISVEEQLSGWYTQVRRAKQRDLLARAYLRLATNVQFLANTTVLPFPEPAILRYEQMKTLQPKIGKMDLRITAITLEDNAILVTRNLRDFQRIPNRVLENWAV